jgi:uncharacterized membrane protein
VAEQAWDVTPQRSTGKSWLETVRQAPDLVALIAIAAIGLGISIYLTTVHYAHISLLCSASGIVNCAEVTQSTYSVVPGTQAPITIPGMLWFAVSGGLAILAWRIQLQRGASLVRVSLAQVGWGAVGLITVLYLVYAEVVRLHAICEWCTAVHILTLLTFLIALYRIQQLPIALDSAAD